MSKLRQPRPDPDLRRSEIADVWSGGDPVGSRAHLVDTTMLFAPRSGGIKRYLLAKRDWIAAHRPGLRHTLVVPGAEDSDGSCGVVQVASAKLPFGDGYRWPTSVRRWSERLAALSPDLIEAADPYGPGHAALEAGERLRVPVVGFCHSDPAALAALHVGAWAEPPVRRRWAQVFRHFDQVIAPSRHIALRLHDAGVHDVAVQPLGVDTDLFSPAHADPAGVRAELGLSPRTRLLVFAGRPAREKNVEVLIAAVEALGDDYHLLLVAAGAGATPSSRVTCLDYRPAPDLARLLAGCDAFVHANDQEPFGLVALEAMACGLPLVGVGSGGIAELVDEQVGQLASAPTSFAMAEAVEALFSRDFVRVGAAARERALTRHGWSATFERLTSLYGGLCGTTRPAPLPARAASPARSSWSLGRA